MTGGLCLEVLLETWDLDEMESVKDNLYRSRSPWHKSCQQTARFWYKITIQGRKPEHWEIRTGHPNILANYGESLCSFAAETSRLRLLTLIFPALGTSAEVLGDQLHVKTWIFSLWRPEWSDRQAIWEIWEMALVLAAIIAKSGQTLISHTLIPFHSVILCFCYIFPPSFQMLALGFHFIGSSAFSYVTARILTVTTGSGISVPWSPSRLQIDKLCPLTIRK